MSFRTVNKELAVSPPVVDKFEGVYNGGIMLTGNKIQLTKVKLIFDHLFHGEMLKAGCTILIKSESAKSNASLRNVMTHEGQSFVLLSETDVVAISNE